MPVYSFAADDGTTISVLVPLTAPDKERHEQVGEDGRVYKRVYAAPLTSVNSRKGDLSKEDFRRMTENKNLKQGELWSLSAEMSREREEKLGSDPVKAKFYRDYERECGVKHTQQIKEEKAREAQRKLEQAQERLKKRFG